MERDAEATRRRLLRACGELLEEAGFGGIGVNAVARRAGVDKVLIYRYFGGLDGLLESFAKEHAEWLSPRVLIPRGAGSTPVPDLLIQILQGHLRELRRRPAVQEIMRWELHERNALTDALAAEREARGLELLRALGFDPSRCPGLDIAAVSAVIYAGLTHVVLRSKTTDHYVGLDLASEEGWERLAAAVEPLIRGVFEYAARHADSQNGR
jgi:AcrR family transcriptional regulator